ncbi:MULTISPECIES: PglL family O-oligosaccharyltransferase [unclassified Acinetobacter]|uniref:PglL family O-oligosaccharyltransferase n=1 Tax=unclassified Acinetobacter TaxID=196816 RepID=UPI0015D0D66B|nr:MULTISPECIES: O-antigen ligase family protein [unclassified Acinetobacter]
MKFFLLLLASIFISLAWLLPIHYRPWVTYTGELYAFFALFALAAIFLKEKLILPKISLPLLALAAVPFIQWACGLLFFFDKALFSSLYIFGFWLAIVLGYNLTLDAAQREKIFTGLSLVFLGVGTLTGLMAICQWLTIDQYFPFIVDIRTGQRPYANFAQPNNMATFLVMSLMACLYLYEKQKLKTAFVVTAGLVILSGVVLSQSRTSWVASLCILAYLGCQQYQGYIRLKWFYSALWFAAFVGLIFIAPSLSQLLSQSADLSVQSRDVVQRATGDMSRLAIWQQMLAAIEHQPWWGYGWHQTSVAYVTVSEFVQGPVWIRSAHNFILDFLLWNGVLLGVPFLAYLGYWGYQLHKHTQSVESVAGILMVGAFSVHAMLEFPQNYAYFLLPVGFIIGMVQSQRVFKSFTLSAIYLRTTFVIGALLLMLIYRDYEVMVPKLNQSVRYEQTPERITHQERIFVLEEFNRRIAWIRLNPYSQQTPDQLQDIHEIVLNYPTRYDLLKYARVLAFNGYEAEAKKQLWLLSTLWQVNVDYATLLDEAKPR